MKSAAHEKNERGRWFGLTPWVLSIMLKNKEKLWYMLNLNKLTLFLSCMSTHWWNSFCHLSLRLCYKHHEMILFYCFKFVFPAASVNTQQLCDWTSLLCYVHLFVHSLHPSTMNTPWNKNIKGYTETLPTQLRFETIHTAR